MNTVVLMDYRNTTQSLVVAHVPLISMCNITVLTFKMTLAHLHFNENSLNTPLINIFNDILDCNVSKRTNLILQCTLDRKFFLPLFMCTHTMSTNLSHPI